MIKELTGGNRRVVAFLKVEEHSASLAYMNEGGMAKRYFYGVKLRNRKDNRFVGSSFSELQIKVFRRI